MLKRFKIQKISLQHFQDSQGSVYASGPLARRPGAVLSAQALPSPRCMRLCNLTCKSELHFVGVLVLLFSFCAQTRCLGIYKMTFPSLVFFFFPNEENLLDKLCVLLV